MTVKARATKAELAKKTATAKGRGCWFPKSVDSGFYKKVVFDGFATGEGVVMGVMDNGIDFYNPSFFHLSGTKNKPVFEPRILAIWAQFDNPTTKEDKDRTRTWLKKIGVNKPYGTVFLKEQLTKMLADYYKADKTEGKRPNLSFIDGHHGTACAGLAAGHGWSANVGTSMGVAPMSDLVVVHYIGQCREAERTTWDGGGVSADPETDGMKFIERVAREDKPDRAVVINQSYGTDEGIPYHVNPYTSSYDDFVQGKKGVVLCGGAGNEGRRSRTLDFTARGTGASRHFQSVPLKLRDDRDDFQDPRSCPNVKEIDHLSGSIFGYARIRNGHISRIPKISVVAKELTSSMTPPVVVEFAQVLSTGKRSRTLFKQVTHGAEYESLAAMRVGNYRDLRFSFSSTLTKPFASKSDQIFKFQLNLSRLAPRSVISSSVPPLKSHKPAKLSSAVDFDLIIEASATMDIILMSDAWDLDDTTVLRGFEFDGSVNDVTWTNISNDEPLFAATWTGPKRKPFRRFRIGNGAAAQSRMATAATHADDRSKTADFSCRGPLYAFIAGASVPKKPTLSAPGKGVLCLHELSPVGWKPDGDGIVWAQPKSANGTSLSSPLVAGAAALILQHKPDMTHAEVEKHLRAHVDTTIRDAASDADEFAANQGAGPLDAFAAVSSLP